jgi:hypothetical protein
LTFGTTTVDTTQLIEVAITEGDLVVQIEGGNRMNGWQSALSLNGTSFDPDIEPDASNSNTAGITYTWECKDLLTNSDCLYRDGSQIDMSAFDN